MRFRIRVWCCVLAFVATLALPRPGEAAEMPFSQWLAQLRSEAIAQGIAPQTFDRAFAGVSPIESVVELDRRQPEFVQTFWRYFEARVTPERVLRGRRALDEHRDLLKAVAQRYRVEPQVIVAFWGLETNFGGNTGDFRAVNALATLAFDSRRDAFFRRELLALLELMEQDDVSVDAQSSWAGALGQMQFMPSTYSAYAVDFDGDGRRDLWNSLGDSFASAANYLSVMGWEFEAPWGQEVRLPETFDFYLTGIDTKLAVADWHRLGVRDIVAEQGLTEAEKVGSIILPGGALQGPALLVYRNFHTIMRWNRSVFYAVAVGNLSDQIAGGEAFRARGAGNEPMLARADILEMQVHLDALGYDTGGVDGIIGSRTRRAIRGFQKSQSIPADGHPSLTVLNKLRTKADTTADRRQDESPHDERGANGD